MKKTVIFLAVVVIILSGCSSRKATVPVNSIAIDYLSQCNVINSQINTINCGKIASYYNTPPIRDLSYISKNIDEVLEPFYSIEKTKDDIINSGDFVIFDLQLLDENDTVIHTDEKAKLMIGAGFLCKNIENDLVGKSTNESYLYATCDTVKKFYNALNADKIRIIPKEIHLYKEESDTKAFLSQHNFANLEDFYAYLFNMKVGEQDFEKNAFIKDAFIKFALEQCTFTIANDDLKEYSYKILEEHIQSAESLGLTLDEYYTNVLSLTENDFFRSCAYTAEYEIQKCLLIGALSHHFNIKVNNDYFDSFCNVNNIDCSDGILKLYANYLCLQNLVIMEFVNLF